MLSMERKKNYLECVSNQFVNSITLINRIIMDIYALDDCTCCPKENKMYSQQEYSNSKNERIRW